MGSRSITNSLNAATARKMIKYLNSPLLSGRIKEVFVTFKKSKENPFWKAIRDVKLKDGREASAVIKPEAQHDTHFHWRFASGPRLTL